MRATLAVLAVAFAFVVLSAALHPTVLGFGGILVFLVLLPLAVAGVRLAADPPAASLTTAPALLILLFIAGVAVTAFYWYRVWTYRAYEMEGIPLVLFYALVFWWPGFGLAVASRFLELPGASVQFGPHAVRLAVGIGAGVLGALAYRTADARYYATRDREPVEKAVAAAEAMGPGVVPGSFRWEHADRTLRLRFAYDPAGRSAYESLLFLENYLWRAAEVTRRKDTERVDVRVQAPAGELLVAELRDGDPDPWARARLDRRNLPDGGRIRPEDLERMSWTTSDQFLHPSHDEVFRAAFRAAVVGDDEVRVAFLAPGPPTGEDVDIHAAAWQVANTVVNETTRFFPEIARFAIDLPGLARSLDRVHPERALAARAGAGPGPHSRGGFRLQSLLGPADRVLALVVREGGRGEPGLDPARFHAASAGVRPGIVLRRVREPLESHLAGHLFEEVLIETGRLYVTGIGEDGAATLIIVPWQEPPLGPHTVPPGAETSLGAERVTNLGWRERRLFRGEIAE